MLDTKSDNKGKWTMLQDRLSTRRFAGGCVPRQHSAGISGLDEILHAGFVPGRTYLVQPLSRLRGILRDTPELLQPQDEVQT